MADLYGFQRNLARALTDVGNERLSRPHAKVTTKRKPANRTPLRAYILQPQANIAAASKAEDGSITLSSGDCWILRRDKSGSGLIYQTNDNGERVTVTAWNFCPEETGDGGEDVGGSGGGGCEATNLFFASQDVFGDLFIVERCEFPCDSSSSGSEGSEGSGECITSIGNLSLASIPAEDDADDVQYVLGITNAGCLVRVPVSECPTGSGS